MDKHLNARPRDQLKAYCKVGRLFDAQKFLEEAGTARPRKTRKWTPLFVAVDRGFHSLVEVLLRFDHAQWDLEKCLQGAFRRRRPDLAGLILRAPSWTGPIDPVEALATGDLELIMSLKESGVDLSAGEAVMRAAMRNVRGVLAAIEHVGIRRESIEDQLYAALVTHSSLGHVSSVFQFLRYGLDRHRVVPYLDEIDGELCDEGSAVSASMYSGKPGFFASLRPDPERDNAKDLIETAVFCGCDKMLKTLFDASFELNCKSNGGSPALDCLLGDVFIGSLTRERLKSAIGGTRHIDERIEKLVKRVEYFVGLGARWIPCPEDRGQLQSIRDVLLAMGDDPALELINLLEREGATRSEDIDSILRTPRMKDLRGKRSLLKL